jgi:uncharacterized membrane protein YozB (DUF420 family)
MLLALVLADVGEGSLIYNIHKFGGYSTLALSLANTALGWKILNDYENGKNHGHGDNLIKAHRMLGYTTLTFATTTTVLGYVNFWKMRKEEVGRKKRLIHGALSTFTTASFLTAGFLAMRGDYKNHRTAAILATGGTLATVFWIIW